MKKQNQFEFKPFDKVLVRDMDNQIWIASLYSHTVENTARMHCCIDTHWSQCIPYNEETAHLLGTNEPYKEPEKKEWYVHDDLGGFEDIFTSEELIKLVTQNVNNKDLHRFTIVYVTDVHNHNKSY